MSILNSELLEFHYSCKSQLNELLKHFNLLFYGYGSKEAVLAVLFPHARVFNMSFLSPKLILEELVLEGYGSRRASTMQDVDEWLCSKGKTLTVVLLNFTFERQFAGLRNIRLVATTEGIDPSFDLEVIESFNLIFRDLTTFEDYEDELMGMELCDSKVQNALMVLNSLSEKSKAVFKALLKLGNCTVKELFDAVKKELFLTKSATVIDLLKEFVDHRIIKIDENGIKLGLSKTDAAKVLEGCE